MRAKRPFAARLRQLMAEHIPPIKGSTALGRVLGVHKQTTQKWLNRTRHLRASDLYRIADYFKVSARWLWLEEGPRERRIVDNDFLNEIAPYVVQITDQSAKEALITMAKIGASVGNKKNISNS